MNAIAYCAPALLAFSLQAQTATVTATGSLDLAWQGGGPTQSASQTVTGAATLQVSTVGSATLTLGTTSTLVLDALSPPGGGWGWWSSASGDVLLSFTATAPIAGVLRLDIVPACIGGGPPTIDVEDDGLIEADGGPGPTTVDVPVVLGPRAIPVRVRADTVNFGGATCTSTCSVQFVPTPANLDTDGVACGPSLAASLHAPGQQPGELVLHVDDDLNAPSSIAAAIAFGATPLALSATCSPGLTPDGWFLVTPTAGGFELPIPLATGIAGTVYLQHVGLQLPFTLQMSNRVLLTLP